MAKKKLRVTKTCLQTGNKPLPDGTGAYGHDGQYRNGGKASTWYSCREQFHPAVRKLKGKNRISIYFGSSKPEALGRLVRYIESRLNIKYTNRTRMHRCKDVKVKAKIKYVYVEISPFWSQNKMRMQFFSILMRAANQRRWDKPWTSPIDAIIKESYFAMTPLALAKFLSGYTCISGSRFDGWVVSFHDISDIEKSVNKMYKPKSRTYLRKGGSGSRLSQEEMDKLKKLVTKFKRAMYQQDDQTHAEYDISFLERS